MPYTYPNVPKGQQLQILIKDEEGEFTKKCSINLSRSIQFNAQTSTTNIPPCEAGDNPAGEDAAWQNVNVEGLSIAIEGAGYVHIDDIPFFFNWWKSGEAKEIKFRINKAGAPVWTGNYKLPTYGVNGEYNQDAQNSLSFASHGPTTMGAMPNPLPDPEEP